MATSSNTRNERREKENWSCNIEMKMKPIEADSVVREISNILNDMKSLLEASISNIQMASL